MGSESSESANISALENIFTKTMNPLDPEEFRRQGHIVIDFLADYYNNIEKYPVRSQVKPGYLRKRLPESAPNNPEPIETILQDVESDIIPGLTHWQSPNFFAYYQSNASIAGVLGEMLSSGFNVVGFSWISSPAATELESIVMDWLGKLLQLPKSFLFTGGGGGVIHSSTCEAILCTLTAARDRKLSQIGRENTDKLVVYGSDQTHSVFQKTAQIAVGTTSSGAVDPLEPICDVAKQYGIWVHVDAAYAGSACICPELRHFIDGVEGATSFSFNAHKWLLTGLDCCCLWVKEPSALVEALSTYPEYLRNKATDSKLVVDYKDWQISLSRRFRAMKLWMVLRSHGVDNLRNYIRGHIEMAKHFEGLVTSDKRFEVVVPRLFAMVCFRVLPSAIFCDDGRKRLFNGECANEFNRELLESVNESGRVYMTHAVIGGVYVIRFAIGATLTEYRHVNMAWKVVQEHADVMLN